MNDPCKATHNACPCFLERLARYEKALHNILTHMEIVTKNPTMSTVWNIAKKALEEK